jgi:hypothetical protein
MEMMAWLHPYGPLGKQVPGGITRWMAVPWQTDTASCRSGYTKKYDPYLPTFWPARVPNHVLTDTNYNIVMDVGQSLGTRLAAFAQRANWNKPLDLKQGYREQINRMIEHFDGMGVVEHRKGPGDPQFPPFLEVQDLPKQGEPMPEAGGVPAPEAVPASDAEEVDLSGIEKVRRFPHGLEK